MVTNADQRSDVKYVIRSVDFVSIRLSSQYVWNVCTRNWAATAFKRGNHSLCSGFVMASRPMQEPPNSSSLCDVVSFVFFLQSNLTHRSVDPLTSPLALSRGEGWFILFFYGSLAAIGRKLRRDCCASSVPWPWLAVAIKPTRTRKRRRGWCGAEVCKRPPQWFPAMLFTFARENEPRNVVRGSYFLARWLKKWYLIIAPCPYVLDHESLKLLQSLSLHPQLGLKCLTLGRSLIWSSSNRRASLVARACFVSPRFLASLELSLYSSSWHMPNEAINLKTMLQWRFHLRSETGRSPYAPLSMHTC